MMNRLRPVTVRKWDTCLTYVMKRVGLDGDVQATSVTELDKEFNFEPFSPGSVKRGDLVAWNKKAEIVELPCTIDEGMTVMNEEVLINFHLGVVEFVEKKGRTKDAPYEVMLSDCVRNTNGNSVPTIRIRTVGNSEGRVREPDFILRKI